MSTEVAKFDAGSVVRYESPAHERSIEELVAQANKIKLAMDKAMEIDQHYGIIPGARKPSLWKPGAEKLCLLFRLDPQPHTEPMPPDLGAGGHLTIKAVCTLYHIPTGQRFGSGEASCSTRESKYAYRMAKRVCPECGKDTIIKGKAEYGGGWLCWRKEGKSDGCGAKFKDGDGTIESQAVGRVANDDLADSYNTVIKMANKRALVAAILNVTAASDVFTQDLEDFAREDAEEPMPAPRHAPATIPDEPREDEAAEARVVDVAQERTILLGRIKAQADRLRLDAKSRSELWEAHVQGDPREAPIEKLADLYAVLKARV